MDRERGDSRAAARWRLRKQTCPNGFENADEVYASLSAVAKEITGSHCNGYLFFHLRRRRG